LAEPVAPNATAAEGEWLLPELRVELPSILPFVGEPDECSAEPDMFDELLFDRME